MRHPNRERLERQHGELKDRLGAAVTTEVKQPPERPTK